MKRIFRSRPTMTEEAHRATSLEVFFDVVFIFAVTRIIMFVKRPPTLLALAQALILLLLLWMVWTTYTWLSNQARADIGLIPAGMTVAMAAIFVVALVIPSAWRNSGKILDPPFILAMAYIVGRVVDLALYFYVVGGDRQMRITLRLFTITTALAWVPLIIGALLGGLPQTLLWAGAFLLDFSGGFVASALSGWRLRSPSHFVERHHLVLVIGIGESMISAGFGAGLAVTRGPVLVAALLAFTIAICLWWLYFKNPAVTAAGKALEKAPHIRRGRVASNAYSLAHFPLIAGLIYTALGIELVIAHLTREKVSYATGPSLGWVSITALYGGVLLFLAGRALFLRFTVRSTPRWQLVAAAGTLLLLPAGWFLPALAALGLLAAFLVALASLEWLRRGGQRPVEEDLPRV